jgi:hypothetical protein
MGMRYELDYEGHPAIRQVFEAPSVYLDHWAIRHFSDTRDDADRFVKALQSANGTLLVSVFNLIEFAPPSSEENARAAEKFLDTVLPNVFVSDLNIDRAVEFEAAHGLSMTPPADPDFMTLIGENPRAGLTDFSFGGWIRFIAESTEIEQSFTQYKNRLADTMNSRRMNPKPNDGAQAFVAKPTTPKTHIYFLELMRLFILDWKLTFKPNDSTDLSHAVVPTAYCTLVLLDGKWVARVGEMRMRLEQAKFPHLPAQVFSGKDDALQRFRSVFEAWNRLRGSVSGESRLRRVVRMNCDNSPGCKHG